MDYPVLTELLDFVSQCAAPPCVCVRARNAYTLAAVDIDTALLAMPLLGHKRIRDGEAWIEVMPGEIFLVPSARKLDIENIPDPAAGSYVAVGIPLKPNVLDAARLLVPECVVAPSSAIAAIALDDFAADLLGWLRAMQAGNLIAACHAIVGVVLKLYMLGHCGLLAPTMQSLGAQIRTLISADPARPWTSRDLEERLAMSSATLRRHLAAEGNSLRGIIAEARLSQALNLLTTTRLPVKSVAYQVGYVSVSSFVKRFCERYGVEPSRLNA